MMGRQLAKKSGSALFLGGLMGAGAALILAPRSGKDLRHRIVVRAGDARDNLFHYVENGRERIASATHRGRKLLDGKRSQVAARFKAGRKAYDEGLRTYKEEKGRITRVH